MCNLYSVTTNREAMRRIRKAMSDGLGNFPELPGIYPDYVAPIVRLDAAGEREIVLARWDCHRSKTSRQRSPTAAPPMCVTLGSMTGRVTSASSTDAWCP